jgi:hypothetical protein
MKCALEMAVEIATEIKLEKIRKAEEERLEKIRKEQERKEKEEKLYADFYNSIEEIDTIVEKALIKGKGKAELLIGGTTQDEEDFGFYCFSEYDHRYYDRNGGHIYWWNTSISPLFHLEKYCEYLKKHCYNVVITPWSAIGYSSTGVSKKEMEFYRMIISI